MTKAFKCDMCDQYVDGEHPYEITILDRYADPRDRETKMNMWLCRKCGKKLWDRSVRKKEQRKRKEW